MAEKKEHPIIRRYVAELLTGRGHAFTRIMLIFIAIQLIRILVMLPFALPNLIRDGTEYIQWKYKQCQVYSQMVDEFKKENYDSDLLDFNRRYTYRADYILEYYKINNPDAEYDQTVKMLGKRRISNGAAIQFIIEMRDNDGEVSLLTYDDGIKLIENCTLFTDEEKAAYIAEVKERKKKLK